MRTLLVGACRLSRLLAVTWWLQLKMIATSAFDGMLMVVWPLFFATAAFLLYRASGQAQAALYAGLGASVMGTWSAIATTASNVLQRERSQGTLELIVSTPTSFVLTLLPTTVAMATLGGYSLIATLLWGRFVFDIPLHVGDPAAFVLCTAVAVASVAMVGFLLSVAVVRYRTAWALGNLLEYPGWLVCGFLIPVNVLPWWVGWISAVLPPTWGMRAIRDVAVGAAPWADLGRCAGVAAGYAALGSLLSITVLRSARRHATLSLS